MRSSIILVIGLCQLCILTYAQKSKTFFRRDYRYFESTESFYKIHTLGKTWQEAKKTCESEGATFFYPEDENEVRVVMNYMATRTENTRKVYVGASSRLVQGVYETINGVLVSNLYENWAPGEPNGGQARLCVTFCGDGTMSDEDCGDVYPFVCKKTLSSLEWDSQCNMPYTGYEYNPVTGRCYKFHVDSKSWTDAYATCKMEMSYLAIINSQVEANVLVNLTQLRKDDNEKKHMFDQVHVGFHNMFDEGWATIDGVPLAETGYASWDSGEPNDAMSNERCGSMYYYGKLNDLRCNDLILFFICEHEIEPKVDSILDYDH